MIETAKAGKLTDQRVGMMVNNYNERAYEKWDAEALVPCENCGRTFLPDRLEIHLRAC